ncbi:MAG: hypothetical protein ABI549_09545 [Flavobacterium sp.]|uniref:hypothetical protein n=1 Tax=Flavobacterium sp. TaxID=239 RepID=UPI003267EC28
MRNLIIYLTVFLCSVASNLYAQDTFESRAKTIASNIEKITKEEKQTLKKQVEEVNVELDKNNITKQQADEKKMQLAMASANTIENRISFEESKLSELVKEKVEGKISSLDTVDKFGRTHGKGFRYYVGTKDTIQRSERRTTSQFVFATGINNLVTDGMIANSDFRYLGSHFYEWGLTYNTRIAQNNNIAHIKYGLSLQYNNLRPTDNRYYQALGNQTALQTASVNLKDSRFRNVNLVVPVHFELDFSKSKMVNDKKIFKSHEGFRLGFGGFAGVNLKTKHILEFDDTFGNSVTQRSKGSYNTNDFVYGLSSYIGFGETSLYVKYDLNTLFSDNVVKQNNISLGIRFDLN